MHSIPFRVDPAQGFFSKRILEKGNQIYGLKVDLGRQDHQLQLMITFVFSSDSEKGLDVHQATSIPLKALILEDPNRHAEVLSALIGLLRDKLDIIQEEDDFDQIIMQFNRFKKLSAALQPLPQLIEKSQKKP